MTSVLSISLDQTGLSLPAYVLHGSADGSGWRIESFNPPALQARLTTMPDSPYVDGSEAIGAAWQQAMLAFTVKSTAADETELQSNYLELAAALAQFSFSVETKIAAAPTQTWLANRGSIQLATEGRTPANVHNLNPVYAVTIPVYPTPS